jgi:hypothetical protein
MRIPRAVQKLRRLSEIVPAEQVAQVMGSLADAIRVETQSRIEMQKVQAARETALEHIRAKHDLYRKVFDHLFDERRETIAKYFEVIDKGIASNNQELILGAMKGLGAIVAASPFNDLKALADVLEGRGSVEL